MSRERIGVKPQFSVSTLSKKRKCKMKNLNSYISERKSKDPKFAKGFDSGYQDFKIGVILKAAREEAGLTQEQLAKKLNTKQKRNISY